jgi:apolipoprotein N-acyltransferase
MLFLAATTGLDKIKAVPPAFWWKLGAAVLCLIVLVIVLQKVAQMNKVVVAVIALVVFTVVGVNWIYERNEPAFMTPIIDKVAPFLPSKGAYGTKQAQTPGQQPTKPTPPPKK